MKDKFNNLAKRLISSTFATISKPVSLLIDNSVYSEDLGEVVSFSDQPLLVDGICGPVNKTRFNGSDIQGDDIQIILPYIDVDQELFLQIDTLKVDGKEYNLIDSVVDASDSVYVLLCRQL